MHPGGITRIFGALLGTAALICTPAATAKDFKPGDLRLCNHQRCVPIMDRDAARAFASFVYSGPRPAIARSPRTGAPTFELRFKNGYVVGLVGSARFDRFLSYGVVCGRFHRGTWYRLPGRAAVEVRRLAAPLRPLRLTASVPRSC